MAKAENKFDQYFRDKLVNHEEKPSKLVWERLENQLNKKKPEVYPMLRIAATILLFLGLGYILWQFSGIGVNEQAPELVSEAIEQKVPEQEQKDQPLLSYKEEEVANGKGLKDGTQNYPTQSKEQAKEKAIQKQSNQEKMEKSSDLLAQAETEKTDVRTDESTVDIPTITLTLPELNLDEAIAAIDEDETPEEFVEYRIIIKSNGLKDEPKKQNIIEGIENNVNKIGGLLSKVEQGFADLQDAKDNLFASNTPRKERSK
jgi:hypothetical protein